MKKLPFFELDLKAEIILSFWNGVLLYIRYTFVCVLSGFSSQREGRKSLVVEDRRGSGRSY